MSLASGWDSWSRRGDSAVGISVVNWPRRVELRGLSTTGITPLLLLPLALPNPFAVERGLERFASPDRRVVVVVFAVAIFNCGTLEAAAARGETAGDERAESGPGDSRMYGTS